MRYRLTFLLILLPSFTLPAEAGILFGRKKEKSDPKARVTELIQTLKSDKDANKRTRAAEELRNFDGAAHPTLIPSLTEALQQDKHANVRAEAAQSLGKLRPISQSAGEALESALASDASMRVRMQARSALLGYHWAGFRSNKKTDVPPLTPQGNTPPAVNTTAKPTTTVPRNTRGTPAVVTPRPSTVEPPLAPPLPTPTPVPAPTTTPLPKGGDTGPELP